MTTPSTPKRSWNAWPVSIIGFFIVAIAGCAAFVAFCVANPTELVSADYYEQEIRYQTEMEGLSRAQALGSAADVRFDAERQQIRVLLPAGHARAESLSGNIVLYRPSEAGLDQSLTLDPDSNGVQTVDAVKLSPGLWEVKVQWKNEGKDYLLSRKIIVGPRLS